MRIKGEARSIKENFLIFSALSSLRENVPRIKKCFAKHVFVIITSLPTHERSEVARHSASVVSSNALVDQCKAS